MLCENEVIQGDTKERELSKCVVAAMYSWEHCGTGTLSYRQTCHPVIMEQWNGQQHALAIKMFYKKMIVWKVRRESSEVFFNLGRHG